MDNLIVEILLLATLASALVPLLFPETFGNGK